MFENYPKIRPTLSREIEDIYLAHYKSNREGQTAASSLSNKMETWMHRQVAADVVNLSGSTKTTLEIGAGTLNQLQYEPSSQAYDIVEPFAELYLSSPHLERIRNIHTDIFEIPLGTDYDRITSVATLEHICNLPQVVARSGLLLAQDGVFRTGIPSEGTLLWALGWKLTTGLEFRLKYGLDYGELLLHEHVNTADEIDMVLSYFFEDITYKVFGLSKSISLYRYYECRSPNIKKCQEFVGPHQNNLVNR